MGIKSSRRAQNQVAAVMDSLGFFLRSSPFLNELRTLQLIRELSVYREAEQLDTVCTEDE